MGCVLDASALLAYLFSEPGDQLVTDRIAGARISSVNWSEVLERSIARGIAIDDLGEELGTLSLMIAPFDHELAATTAHLREPTKSFGLGLADRACLALASEQRLPVLTADRSWAELDLGIEIELIR